MVGLAAFTLCFAALGSLADPKPPTAVVCDKLLTMDASDRILSPGMVWMEGGRLSYVGAPRAVPAGFERVELKGWAAPGLVDLHTHIHSGGWGDTNDMCRTVNPELRSAPALRPANRKLEVACAGGVTTLLGIPGSGTNISGFGVLYKAKTSGGFDSSVMAAVGGMKVAQDSNPQGRAGDFGFGNSRASMSWALIDVCERALGARRDGRFDPALEDLARVLTRELPVLIHTAGSDGVVNTARMWKRRYDTRCTISHGSFDGWKAAKAVAEWGVPVNHGPRTVDYYSSRNGRVNGTSAEYVAAGVPLFSLNTDSAVIPQEEFFLQGSMSARYGAPSYQMLRAVTIHPAQVFGIDDRVGSLEEGKDADVVVYSGDPLDPRSRVERVWIDGELQYACERGGQVF
ncbi:MAG: amidohydrolase family protein [Planctomycetota bacterium]|nr:amidohydrolase family protein [Planctomycetota bacterium]MDP6763075.1 amidohydrolase family protein [Planctomycetota bacterium]MDP6989028.1 amidohydrolase family protein [Planctomycetota bacterium]